MSKIKILGIAPYEGFKKYFSNAIEKYENIDADIYSASLSQAVVLIQTLDLSSYDAIVSRGRTGKMIKNIVSLPVINVDFSGYDILRSLKLAQCGFYQKIAFVSFFDIVENVKFLCELMEYHPNIIIPPPPQSPMEMESLIQELYNDGVQLFIGDGACVDYAKIIGADCILVTSGPESMANAIENVIELCEYKQMLIKKNSFFYSLIKSSSIPIAVFDQEENLIHTNVFSLENTENVYQYLQKLIEKVFAEHAIKAIKNDGKMLWRIRGETIEFENKKFALFFLLDSFICHQKIREIFNIIEYAEAQKCISLISNSPSLSTSWDKIQTLSSSKMPILVYGEAGTGKSTFVQAVYATSSLQHNSLIVIECGILDSKTLTMLFENEKSPLFENDFTILFKDISFLSMSLQNRLNYYLKNSAFISRNKVFSTFSGNPTTYIAEKQFSQELYYTLAGFLVHVPSLSARADEILSIARVYLNKLNQEFPTQVVGFEPEALQILKKFPWQYGIVQFKMILKQLVLASDSQLITAKNVNSVLSQIETIHSDSQKTIDLNQNLDSICKSVVTMVLHEEDMNQSRAAKRLGISRSTLWKKLK